MAIADALYQQPLDVADPEMEKAPLFREAVNAFVPAQTSRRLTALGGNPPDMPDIHRRRKEPPQ
jgi:hypothetical protein